MAINLKIKNVRIDTLSASTTLGFNNDSTGSRIQDGLKLASTLMTKQQLEHIDFAQLETIIVRFKR